MTRIQTQRDDLVFDIGANNGDDAAVYLSRGLKVIAVEANPALVLTLKDRFAPEIASGQLVVVDRAISRLPKVTLYVNTSDHGWGTTVESYAERGRKLRGEVVEVEVETITLIDLIRKYGTPHRVKIDIEGADVLCLLDLYGGELPVYLSIERPKSLSEQIFVLTLLRRMGYARFAFVDQTVHGEEAYTTTGRFSEELPADLWTGPAEAWLTNARLGAEGVVAGVMRRTPGLKARAPRGRWYDIHVRL